MWGVVFMDSVYCLTRAACLWFAEGCGSGNGDQEQRAQGGAVGGAGAHVRHRQALPGLRVAQDGVQPRQARAPLRPHPGESNRGTHRLNGVRPHGRAATSPFGLGLLDPMPAPAPSRRTRESWRSRSRSTWTTAGASSRAS